MALTEAEHRYRCEVRWCIRMGGKAFQAWFFGDADRPSFEKMRGEAAALKFRADVRAQVAAGNTGEPGMWIETGEQS